MGAGKTSVGRAVAARAGVAFTDLDDAVAARAGRPVAELFAAGGEPAFRALEAAVLPAVIEVGGVVALGGGTVLRDASWRLLRERAVTVWLEAPFDTLWPRIAASDRPLVAGGRESAAALLASRTARYAECDHRVDATRPVDVIAEEVWRLWAA